MTTITGTILLPSGAPYKGRVTFTSSNTPAAVLVAPTAVLLTKKAVFATDDTGLLVSCSLKPLIYTVTFDTSELDTIYGFVVPDSADEQDFALLASYSASILAPVTARDADVHFSGGEFRVYNLQTGKFHRAACTGTYPNLSWVWGPEVDE